MMKDLLNKIGLIIIGGCFCLTGCAFYECSIDCAMEYLECGNELSDSEELLACIDDYEKCYDNSTTEEEKTYCNYAYSACQSIVMEPCIDDYYECAESCYELM